MPLSFSGTQDVPIAPHDPSEEKLLLGQAYQEHGLVFYQANGKPIDPRNFLWSSDRIIEQAGLPPSRSHDARHTFAILMLELGELPKTVQAMLGHSRVVITLDIYSHVSLGLEKRQPRSSTQP